MKLNVKFLYVVCLVVILSSQLSSAFFGGAPPPPPRREEIKEVDYYKILGLEDKRESATEKDIKQSFRKLSKMYHPDVATVASEEAKEKFKEIQRANEVLSDKRRRKMYDLRGEEGLQMLEKHMNTANNGGGMQHPFAQFFGGNVEASFKGQDAEVRLEVQLADFFTGHHRTLTLNKKKVCHACRGRGHPPGVHMHKCSTCHGQGAVRQRIQFAPGMFQEVMQHCPHCEGTGQVPASKCTQCRGQKLVSGQSTLEVAVERGAPEGYTIKFDMEADEQIDRLPGDLIVHVYSANHTQVLRRRRNNGPREDPENNLDLDTTIAISLKEALLGFTHTLKHLDEVEEVVVERRGITPHGTVLKLKDKGMPKHHVPSERGDLYVTVQVRMPSSLTDAQREWIEKNL